MTVTFLGQSDRLTNPEFCKKLAIPLADGSATGGPVIEMAELDAGLLDAESPADAYSVAVAGLIPSRKL